MSVDVDLYKSNFDKLSVELDKLCIAAIGRSKRSEIEKALLFFGFKFGNEYIILCDEHSEYCNSLSSLTRILEDLTGADRSLDVLLDLSELLECHKSPDDFKELLK